MIHSAALHVVEFVVLGLTGAGFLICAAVALFLLPCQGCSGKAGAQHKFNRGWPTRLILQLAAACWLLSQWLRLSILWERDSRIMPAVVTRWTGGGVLCRVYLCLSLGLFQPLVLLTVLVLCTESLRRGKTDGSVPNTRLLVTAAMGAGPVLALQGVIAWISMAFSDQHWQSHRGLLPIFFAPYLEGDKHQCQGLQRCMLCVFPAASCIVSVIFSAIVAFLLWICTNRMMRRAVNQLLHDRIYALQVSSIAGLALEQALQSATIAVPPFTWAFQLLWLASSIALCWLVATASLLLVLLPVWESSRSRLGLEVDGGVAADVPLLSKT